MGRPFRHPLRVRFHECDPQGIVFNANFLAYADIAMTELYREAFGSWKAVMDEGIDMVVAEATVRFLTPLHFDEEIELVATVTRIGNTATTTVIGVERGGRAGRRSHPPSRRHRPRDALKGADPRLRANRARALRGRADRSAQAASSALRAASAPRRAGGRRTSPGAPRPGAARRGGPPRRRW